MIGKESVMSAQEVIMDLPKVLKCDPLESKMHVLACCSRFKKKRWYNLPFKTVVWKKCLQFLKKELKHHPATLIARMFVIFGGLFCFVDATFLVYHCYHFPLACEVWRGPDLPTVGTHWCHEKYPKSVGKLQTVPWTQHQRFCPQMLVKF